METHKPVLLLDFDGTIRATGGGYGKVIYSKIKKIAIQKGFTEDEFISNANMEMSLHHFGMFNQVLSLCDYDQEKYNKFCEEVFELIDYSCVRPDPHMYELILKVSQKYNIYCATNNHRIHVDKALNRLFGKGINEIPELKLLDINQTK